MKFEEEFFSKDDLLDRGWSNSMINKFTVIQNLS